MPSACVVEQFFNELLVFAGEGLRWKVRPRCQSEVCRIFMVSVWHCVVFCASQFVIHA